MLTLAQLRQKYTPPVPKILRDIKKVALQRGEATTAVKDVEELKKRFPRTFGQPLYFAEQGKERATRPLRVGVVLSGGQAAGGHNVIAALFDGLQALHSRSHLFGFLNGPGGIVSGKYKELSAALIASYRNQGGFDLIGSGRTKIETPEQLDASHKVMQSLQLDGLVIIGGDDSNTNAAILAEYFLTYKCATKVIGVPKTIDGDLKNSYLATSFGFDTACKTYSEMIGNISRDALSAKKYYHFIKVMGRSASHIALECALSTQPNMTLIGEEIAAQKKTLAQVTAEICDLICKRSEQGKEYGVILIPEGLIEFIPEVNVLINELNPLVGMQLAEVAAKLTPASQRCFHSLPESIQKQLLLERDPHGNINVSSIETERLFIAAVQKELQERSRKGSYKGKFSAIPHFFGYEGRAGFPSNFDSNYCYALGLASAVLIDEGLSGYMCSIQDLARPVSEWKFAALPLTMLMNIEMRKGQSKPVIQKAPVDLKGKPFAHYQKERSSWALQDLYLFPGPIQFFGEPALIDNVPHVVSLG